DPDAARAARRLVEDNPLLLGRESEIGERRRLAQRRSYCAAAIHPCQLRQRRREQPIDERARIRYRVEVQRSQIWIESAEALTRRPCQRSALDVERLGHQRLVTHVHQQIRGNKTNWPACAEDSPWCPAVERGEIHARILGTATARLVEETSAV